MENRPTPGPWEVEEDFVVIAAGVQEICRVLEVDDFPCVEEGTEEDVQTECKANARLIAAAPDLLAALTSIVAGQIHGWTPDILDAQHIDITFEAGSLRAARAAIAKTEAAP